MARAPRLKVYCMPAGFHDALVAAPSQKAALQAWGTTTDLFAAGRASVIEEGEGWAEALATPGTVVKRLRGDAAAMLDSGPGADEPRAASRRRAATPRPESPARRRPARSPAKPG